MKCRECKHWQGNKHSTEADCYRVLGSLVPGLEACCYRDEKKNTSMYLTLPFDPHMHNYWQMRSPTFRTLMKEHKETELPEGVRVDTVDERDFYMTSGDYSCGKFEEKG